MFFVLLRVSPSPPCPYFILCAVGLKTNTWSVIHFCTIFFFSTTNNFLFFHKRFSLPRSGFTTIVQTAHSLHRRSNKVVLFWKVEQLGKIVKLYLFGTKRNLHIKNISKISTLTLWAIILQRFKSASFHQRPSTPLQLTENTKVFPFPNLKGKHKKTHNWKGLKKKLYRRFLSGFLILKQSNRKIPMKALQFMQNQRFLINV